MPSTWCQMSQGTPHVIHVVSRARADKRVSGCSRRRTCRTLFNHQVAATGSGSNSVPSIHIRCRITASRRANATFAFLGPIRLLSRRPHCCSRDGCLIRVRRMWAASNNRLRVTRLPHFEIRPAPSTSPDWSSATPPVPVSNATTAHPGARAASKPSMRFGVLLHSPSQKTPPILVNHTRRRLLLGDIQSNVCLHHRLLAMNLRAG